MGDDLQALRNQRNTLAAQLAAVQRQINQMERQQMIDTLTTYFAGMTFCRVDWRHMTTHEYKRGRTLTAEDARQIVLRTIDYTEDQHGNIPAFVTGAIVLGDWRVTIEPEGEQSIEPGTKGQGDE